MVVNTMIFNYLSELFISNFQIKFMETSFLHPNRSDFLIVTQVVIETGKLATQAHGSVVVKVENTMLLATVVASPDAKPDQSFSIICRLPRAICSSLEKIPGNFFPEEKPDFRTTK